MITNDYITIQDVISFLDTTALKEEAKQLTMAKECSDLQKVFQRKRTSIAKLLLKLAKKAAITNQPGSLASLIQQLPE